jgi:hypothetical protein
MPRSLKIGVIGSGKLGMTAANLFVAHGHRVALANSRGPNSMPGLVVESGGLARAATTSEAAIGGDLVLLALPFGRHRDLPVEPFRRKLVVDATNYRPERDGSFPALETGLTTSSELIAQHLQGARVVKAFNTMPYEILRSGGRTDVDREQRLPLFLSGDDGDAKALVAALIEQLGFAPVDSGSLSEGGRLQQPGGPLYNTALTQYEARAAAGRH